MSELRTLARGVPAPEWRRIVDVVNPGAGLDVSIPVPSKKAWRLLSVSCTFVAAAVAGNRNLVLASVDAGGVPLVAVPALASITSGQTRQLTWATGVGATVTGAGTGLVLPIPDPWYLLPGETITIVGHTDAGDAFSAIRVVVIETNTGDVVHEREMQQAIIDHYAALHDLLHLGAT